MINQSEFSNLFSLQKTLRFELIPVGKTQEYIEYNGIIKCDTKRAESYKKMKKTIDKYHMDFIESSLRKVSLSGLAEFYMLYTSNPEEKKTDTYKKQFPARKQLLRKEIVKCFKDGPQKNIFKNLDKKKLIQEEIEKWLQGKDKELYFDPDFKSFTTYFSGYNTNRMNMYKDEEKATAIAYRIINENLPKFIDNMLIFEDIKNTDIYSKFPEIYEEIKDYLDVTRLEEVFELEYFNNTLTQSMINKYNSILGGIKTEDRKVKGLNEYINEYNQKSKDRKIPKLKMLYKQMLSERESFSYLPEEFETTQEMLDDIADFYENQLCSYSDEYSGEEANVFNSLKAIVSSLSKYDLQKVYIRNDFSINNVSKGVFDDFSIIRNALEYYYENVVAPDFLESYKKANDKKRKQLDKQKKDYISEPAFLPIGLIQDALDCFIEQLDKNEYENIHAHYSRSCIADYFSAFGEKDGVILINELYHKYQEAQNLFNTSFPDGYNLTDNEKGILKAFLDSILSLLHFVKPLYLNPDSELPKDELFHSAFAPVFEQLQKTTFIYDKARNYLTKKPYSTEKVKLNFSNPTLLEGWDVNKEPDYGAVLFEQDGLYYVGILNDRKLFKDIESKFEYHSDEKGSFRKIIYKQIPEAAKYISSKQILPQKPPQKIVDILEKKKADAKSLTKEEIHSFIDYCKKDFLQNYSCLKDSNGRDYFEFNLKPTDEYETLNQFFDDVNKQAYSVSFLGISGKYINNAVDEGRLYLFKIWNKDFSSFSKGKPNLHTLYWRALFAEDNIKDISYKLNGKAEIFYRKASILKDNKVIHKANQPIVCKNPNLKHKKSVFEYDIIKDRRYTCDKYQFHVPITLNFKSDGQTNVNDRVLKYLKNNQDINVIGIDRGERHLLYISLLNRDGNVVLDENGNPLQYSLNDIAGVYRDNSGTPVSIKTPYRELLGEREDKRKDARKKWETIEGIKDLKEGYMSQVIHHIARLMVKYNAIIVMEDLNSGFKNNRVKIEKQVYQKFEKQLINKLNYMVFKELPEREPGGLYQALQMSNKFESFKKMTKQNGFIFYVSPWNTSKIDPVTGFVDLLKPKYTNIPDARVFFNKFESIKFNSQNDYFEFEFDYSQFTEKANGTRTRWTVCTYGNERYTYNRSLNGGRGGYEKWNVTEKLKSLFKSACINCNSSENLKHQILEQDNSVFFVELIRNLKITLALRYSDGSNRDFILSPISKDGFFFHSEKCKKTLPQDGDANGAFNIARKGLCLLGKIDLMDDIKKPDLKILNKEWLDFVQTRLV